MIINIPNVGDVEFPDSMSQADIDSASKKLYEENLPKQAQPKEVVYPSEEAKAAAEARQAVVSRQAGRKAVVQPITPLEAVAGDVAKGFILNAPLAVTQIVGGQKGRDYVSGIQKQQQQARKEAGLEGVAVGELIGTVFSPFNKLIPGGGYTGGAIGAVSQPLEGENLSAIDVVKGKVIQGGSGAVLGKITENLISALTPTLKAGTQELIDKGIPVSPGQAYEGAPGWLFRQVEALGLGPKAADINKSFNKAVGNEVLSSINQTLPDTVAPGFASVRLTQRRISNFYDETLANLGKNVFDKEYKDGVSLVIRNTLDDIADKPTRDLVQKRLVNSLNANIGSKLKNGQIDGNDLKSIQEWLKTETNKYNGKTGTVPESLKSSYSDILANLNQYISRVDKSGNIAKADAAWAKLYSYADASGKANKTGGVFSPEQLASAAASQAQTTLSKGGGKAPLSTTADKAIDILGTQKEVSLPSRLFLASKVATGAATTWAAPAIAIPILTAAGMTYAAAKQLMKNPSATRLAVKQALENNSGLFGATGQNLLNQINNEPSTE